MKRCFWSFAIIAVFAVAGLCPGYPEPAVVPGSGEWTLEVVFEHPQQISVKIPGETVERRFWYTILTLTNNEGFDVPFYPSCDLMTDTFQVIEAGKKTRKAVFDRIKLRHQGRYPFLEPLDFVDSSILQGVDNTIDVAVIWPDFDHKAKNISLFIAGLSNETVVIDHPVATEADGKPVKVYLRKTLMLEYSIGGDAKLRAEIGLVYKGKHWVMR